MFFAFTGFHKAYIYVGVDILTSSGSVGIGACRRSHTASSAENTAEQVFKNISAAETASVEASGKSSAAEVGVNSRMTELIVSLTFFRIGKYFISFV